MNKKLAFTEDSYKPLPNIITIGNSGLDGLGLVAKETILPLTLIGLSHVLPLTSSKWIRTPIGGFLNHSEKPNCFIRKNWSGTKRYLWTKKKIKKGEELTVYYELPEYYRGV